MVIFVNVVYRRGIPEYRLRCAIAPVRNPLVDLILPWVNGRQIECVSRSFTRGGRTRDGRGWGDVIDSDVDWINIEAGVIIKGADMDRVLGSDTVEGVGLMADVASYFLERSVAPIY